MEEEETCRGLLVVEEETYSGAKRIQPPSGATCISARNFSRDSVRTKSAWHTVFLLFLFLFFFSFF